MLFIAVERCPTKLSYKPNYNQNLGQGVSLDHACQNYSTCNLFLYLMAFVGFFVVNGEGRIGVTESRYLKRDSYILKD